MAKSCLMTPDFAVPLLVWGLIQIIKVVIDFATHGKMGRKALWSAGWFPSVHAWIAASITTLMLLKYGVDSSQFAMSFTFSFLFWYDAANVRYEAGQHASFLNRINEELEGVFDFEGKIHTLKERLGHTFFEVLGGIIIGVALTSLYNMFFSL